MDSKKSLIDSWKNKNKIQVKVKYKIKAKAKIQSKKLKISKMNNCRIKKKYRN